MTQLQGIRQFQVSRAFAVLALAALPLLSACGREEVRDFAGFESYVAEFEAQSAAAGAPIQVTDLAIKLGDVPGPYNRGVCEVNGQSVPTITIDAEKWAGIDEDEREELLFHEMGHCVLGRKHKADLAENGHPASVMYGFKIDGEVYRENRPEYLRELFQNR